MQCPLDDGIICTLDGECLNCPMNREGAEAALNMKVYQELKGPGGYYQVMARGDRCFTWIECEDPREEAHREGRLVLLSSNEDSALWGVIQKEV